MYLLVIDQRTWNLSSQFFDNGHCDFVKILSRRNLDRRMFQFKNENRFRKKKQLHLNSISIKIKFDFDLTDWLDLLIHKSQNLTHHEMTLYSLHYSVFFSESSFTSWTFRKCCPRQFSSYFSWLRSPSLTTWMFVWEVCILIFSISDLKFAHNCSVTVMYFFILENDCSGICWINSSIRLSRRCWAYL